MDEMWYIYASDEVRRKRLEKNRNYTRERIDHIMANQLSEEAFRKDSDFVIDNNGDLSEAYSQIKKRLEAYTWQE